MAIVNVITCTCTWNLGDFTVINSKIITGYDKFDHFGEKKYTGAI